MPGGKEGIKSVKTTWNIAAWGSRSKKGGLVVSICITVQPNDQMSDFDPYFFDCIHSGLIQWIVPQKVSQPDKDLLFWACSDVPKSANLQWLPSSKRILALWYLGALFGFDVDTPILPISVGNTYLLTSFSPKAPFFEIKSEIVPPCTYSISSDIELWSPSMP